MGHGIHNNMGAKEDNHCVTAVRIPGTENSHITQVTPGYPVTGARGMHIECYRLQH